LESKGEDAQVTVSSGTWKDQGDGSIRVSIEDSNKKQIQLVFSLDGDNLTSIEYPAFYGEAGVNMKRLVAATAAPEPQQTPVPGGPTPVPPSKPSLPFCGSAALAPLLAAAFWWTRNWLRHL
jgi:hypothetical protein